MFFFFKQKTAYELRISDWSSDVCSSDLRAIGHLKTVADRAVTQPAAGQRLDVCLVIDHQRAAIDDPGGEQDGARAYRKFSGLSDEAVPIGNASGRERV